MKQVRFLPPQHLMSKDRKIQKLIAAAESLIGKPYKYGAYAEKTRTQKYFDCSSFIQAVYDKIGIDLPRSSLLQAIRGKEIKNVKKLKPGDLLFFEGTKGHYWHKKFKDRKIYIGHVALYIGEGKIIDAEEDRGNVNKLSLNNLTAKKFYNIVLIKRIL